MVLRHLRQRNVFAIVAAFGLMVIGLTLATYWTLTANRGESPSSQERAQQTERPGPADKEEQPPSAEPDNVAGPVDRFGDPLPPGAVARLGTSRLRQADAISAYAFSPDGKILATGGSVNDYWLHLWDTTTGKLLRRLPENGVTAIAFSPDGKGLAVLSRTPMKETHIIRFWDLQTGREQRHIRGPAVIASQLAYTPDGKTLIGLGGAHLAAWDVETGLTLRGFADRAGTMDQFAVAPDGKSIASINLPGDKVALTDESNRTHREFAREGLTFTALAFSPDGKRLAVGTDGTEVLFLDTATMKPTDAALKRPDDSSIVSILALAFSADGKDLLVIDREQHVQVCDAATGRHRRWCVERGDFIHSAVFAPDGKSVAVLDYGNAENRQAVHLLDLTTGKERLTTGKEHLALDGHTNGVRSLSFSPNGKALASTAMNGVTIVWDVAHARKKWSVADKHELPGASAFDPSGRRVAASGKTGRVELFDADTGEDLRTLDKETANARGLAFSADGQTLAILKSELLAFAGLDRSANPLNVGITNASSVVLDRSGRWAAAVPAGAWLGRLPGDGKANFVSLPERPEKTCVALAPDGAALAIGGVDGDYVYLCDPNSPVDRRRIQHREEPVRSVALSSRGLVLATGGAQGTVRLFDATTGTELVRLEGHEGPVQALTFSEDGRLLASAGSDTTILVWDMARVWAIEAHSRHAPTLAAVWTDLDHPDRTVALRAAAAIDAHKVDALPFFREQLKPVPADHVERLQRAVSDLQNEDYQVRDRALAELRGFGSEAIPPLLALQRTATEPKLKTRVRAFLTWADAEGIRPPRPVSRELLAVQGLERIGTPEARQVLENVPQGNGSAPLTEAARAALRRMP